jgi:hypothetical protein
VIAAIPSVVFAGERAARSLRRDAALRLAGVALAVLGAHSAGAVDGTWTGATSGDWTVGTN